MTAPSLHTVSTVVDEATGLSRATCTCGKPFPPHRSPSVAASVATIHSKVAR